MKKGIVNIKRSDFDREIKREDQKTEEIEVKNE